MANAHYLNGTEIRSGALKDSKDTPLWVCVPYDFGHASTIGAHKSRAAPLKMLEPLFEKNDLQTITSLLTSKSQFQFTQHDRFVFIRLAVMGHDKKMAEPWGIVLTAHTTFLFLPAMTSLDDSAFLKKYTLQTPFDVFLGLLSEIFERNAFYLAEAEGLCEEISIPLFMHGREIPPHNHLLSHSLIFTGKVGVFVMKIQQSLEILHLVCSSFLDADKLQDFMPKPKLKRHKCLEMLTRLSEQIDSQGNLGAAIMQNVAYISDAVIGMVSINQNRLMMFLSILATVLIPPSLVVSLFSIQFAKMPNLHWAVGFALLLGGMFSSSLAAYYFLKKRALD